MDSSLVGAKNRVLPPPGRDSGDTAGWGGRREEGLNTEALGSD